MNLPKGCEIVDITFYYNKNKIQLFKIFSGTLSEIVPMHSHTKNSYEVHLIDYGSGVLETDSERYSLSKNTLFITGPNLLHKQIPDKTSPMHELCVYFRISDLKKENDIVSRFASQSFWIGKSNAEIRHLFKQMVEEKEKSSHWQEDILSSLSIRLISEIARLYFPDNTHPKKETAATDLNESRSWILDQLFSDDCSNVTLNDFSVQIGVSQRQAERIIKDYYGSSFKKLRYESKMALAATLLEEKNITVEECAVKCGYSSASAFISAFKKKYKITPNKYREQMIKK